MSKQPAPEVTQPAASNLPAPLPAAALTLDPATDPLLTRYVNEDEGRRQIWQAANEAFRGVLVKVGEWFLNVYRVDILQRYQLAELLKKVHDDHARNCERRYGSYAVRRLVQFFRWEVSTLYAALRLAEAYTRQEIEAVSLLRLQDGRPLSYYHVELLAHLNDRQVREDLLRQTLAGCWSTRELAFRIHQLASRAKKETDGRGRPLAVPRNLDALLRQQDRTAEDFLNRSLKVWEQPQHSLVTMVRTASQEECTQGRVAQLLALARKLRRLAEEAHKRAEEAEQAYAYVLRGLEGRANRPAAPAACSAEQDCFGTKQSPALATAVTTDKASERPPDGSSRGPIPMGHLQGDRNAEAEV